MAIHALGVLVIFWSLNVYGLELYPREVRVEPVELLEDVERVFAHV